MKTTQTWKIGDCLQLLPEIPDKSIDMILTDLPYGTTACKWDAIIPFDVVWTEYMRIIKENSPIVLTASQPFTSKLILSNIDWFKYELIWDKMVGKNPGLAKIRPLPAHESILVFGKGSIKYNPCLLTGKKYRDVRDKPTNVKNGNEHKFGFAGNTVNCVNNGYRYPLSVLQFMSYNQEGQHPTQKPLALWEYLIQTYTNEGDTVHDSCLGSGTTLEACMNTNRNCIGFELLHDWEEHYRKRLRLDNTKLDAWTT